MRNLKQNFVAMLAGVGSLAVTGLAFGQDANANAQAGGGANVGMTLPGAGPGAAAAVGSSDHDQVVGRLAVGYLGRRSMQVGVQDATFGGVAPAGAEVNAPVVGIRYWIDESLGIDAGLGLFIGGGSGEVDNPAGNTSFDLNSFTVFILHAGVPLSLASADHFSFQIIPEANVGIGSGQAADGDVKHNGFHLDLGARAGAEIQFGFMNIPQLSLQGSIGVVFDLNSLKTDDDTNNADTTYTSNSTAFSTTVNDNPWNIFTSNVAALYYF